MDYIDGCGYCRRLDSVIVKISASEEGERGCGDRCVNKNTNRMIWLLLVEDDEASVNAGMIIFWSVNYYIIISRMMFIIIVIIIIII